MKITLKRCSPILAVIVGLGVGGTIVVPAVATPFFQDQERDYSKNRTYQQGVREGNDDRAHNRDHSKKRHFKKDEDQKAYEAGYQKARGN